MEEILIACSPLALLVILYGAWKCLLLALRNDKHNWIKF